MRHDEAVHEIEERERRRFRPFIWIGTQDGAHSFLTAIAERQLKALRLPEGFEDLSESAGLEAVRRRVRDHYRKTTGKYIGFDAILDYSIEWSKWLVPAIRSRRAHGL